MKFLINFLIIASIFSPAHFLYTNITKKSLNSILEVPNNRVNKNLIDAVQSLIDWALYETHQTIYYVAEVNNNEEKYFKDLLTELLKMSAKSYVNRLDTVRLFNPLIRYVRQNTVFLIDDVDNFHMLSESIIPERYRLNGNFLIILVYGYFKEIGEIFEVLWKKNIFSASVIYEQAGEVILTSFMPFESSSTCGNTKPKILAKFSNGSWDREIKFTRRLRNLQKCPIRIVTYVDPGYINIQKFKNGSYELSGRGINFMNTLAEYLNYTNEIRLGKGELPWGMIFDNGTITGNFAELHHNTADIAFSEYYMKGTRSKYFDESLTQYTTPMVFIIPPGRPYGFLEKMLQPFDAFVWTVLLITISIAVLVILMINLKFVQLKAFIYGRGVKTPITNILAALFGLQQTVVPGRNFARFILMMFLILCLVLRSIYQGSLFQFLQSDKRHKEVQSIAEMIEKNFTFYMYESALDVVNNNSDFSKRTKLFNTSRNFLLDNLLNGNEKIAGLDSLLTVQGEIYNGSQIRYCKESLMTFNVVLYFRKNFYLRDEINAKINCLLSSGIIEHWKKSSHKYEGYRLTKDNRPRKLKIDDLKGPFTVVMSGNLVALVVFMLEIFEYKSRRNVLRKRVRDAYKSLF